MLRSPSPVGRAAAPAGVSVRRDPSMAGLLAAPLASENPDVRREAVRALAALGGSGARFLLARAANDPRAGPEERAEVRRLLALTRRIDGRPGGEVRPLGTGR